MAKRPPIGIPLDRRIVDELRKAARKAATPKVDNRKAQTMRLSQEVLDGLRVRAERFKTTQAALVEQYLREAFERHPVPPYQGI
jgi:hypothetical protein